MTSKAPGQVSPSLSVHAVGMVSIVTPVYNGARYLALAIDSVLAQTDPNWELIVVDDGSTDATPAILDRYAGDPRVQAVRQANAGEAAARNRGLALATGEFVAFLDADDEYLPNALADATAFLRAHGEYDVVFSDGFVCDERGTTLTRLSDHRPGRHEGDILEPLVLQASVVTVPVCTMTRRAAIERSQARFDTSLVIGPDWDFWIQLARTCRFGYLDVPTCKYRVHLSNVTRTSGQRRRREDLVAGRMKVLSSDWFAGLSAPTRRQFLHDLLVDLLDGDVERQGAILSTDAFRALPARERAELWRRVAIGHIVKGREHAFAAQCLAAAAGACADDRKTRVLARLVSSRRGQRLAPAMLRTWTRLQAAANRARHPARRRPKPVPAALRPVGE